MSQISIFFCSVLFFLSSHADFNKVTEELRRKQQETQLQIDPLMKEAADLQQKNVEAKAEVSRREEQAKLILAKTEALQNQNKTSISNQDLADILLRSTVGRCSISKGLEANEYYIKDNGISIRVIFADESSSSRPQAKMIAKNGNEYLEIEQLAFDPADSQNTTGLMTATIRLDSQKNVVHAVFKGESINDKGPMGWFGSNFFPLGMTCITNEANDSI